MDGSAIMPNDPPGPPSRIWDRLRQIAGYTWDDTQMPFHSSYDNWHFFGTRLVAPSTVTSPNPYTASSPPSAGKHAASASSRAVPAEPPALSVPTTTTTTSDVSGEHYSAAPPPPTTPTVDVPPVEMYVVARVSFQVLREERAFNVAKRLIQSASADGEHIVKPIDLLRLTSHPGDRGPIIVAIYEAPGPNSLHKLLDLGPAFYKAHKVGDRLEAYRRSDHTLDPPISLHHFLDFAVGATQCLEMIHHGMSIIHGEIRGDVFHYNMETGKVRLVSFGSGIRSFEHGLTSTGWSALSRELGAKNKLLYISPEQTGRMPAEPDTRTDIYSLGVLMWTLLAQRPVFDGETPLDIVQGVLNRRIPSVSSYRIDIPDVLGRIIQKCTSKNVADRYFSASGLRHDLVQVQRFLAAGDWLALREWQIASRDVSSFFMLPTVMIGRSKERADLLKVIERAAKSHSLGQRGGTSRYSDGSSLSQDFLDCVDGSSEGGASSGEGTNHRSGSFTQTNGSDTKTSKAGGFLPPQGFDAQTLSDQTVSSGQSGPGGMRPPRLWDRHQSVSLESRSIMDSLGGDSQSSSQRYNVAVDSSSLSRQLGAAKFRRRGHCEIVTIEGAGGLGKSRLVQSVLADARRRGYCATAKFDPARRTAYGPLLMLLSSLFRQVWGERNTETPFHQALKQYVRPVWPTLHKILGLPEFLLGAVDGPASKPASASSGSLHTKSLRSGARRRESSPSSPGPSSRTSRASAQSSQDFLRAGTLTKTTRLMNTFLDVLRMFTHYKFICFCLDDLHFADDESLELITQVIGARMRMVVIITYRSDEIAPEKVRSVLQPQQSEDFPRSGGPALIRITLSPLGEEDMLHYVSATLCRPKEEVLPLALVLQSKTAGNPFYMREMLKTCHRKRCIWHDYKENKWKFDLDRLFEQFQGEQNYDVLNTDFITRRMDELPPASRAILAWAALLGHSFSFDLICRLLSGEFDYGDEMHPDPQGCRLQKVYTQAEAVDGLQAAIQAYILVPGEKDDQFRFAHDRYVQASGDLKECNPRKMHFIIAQTLLRYYEGDAKFRDNAASHICESVDIIRRRVSRRQAYRKLLISAGHSAGENGARSTAAKYYSNAVSLLQPDPWDDSAEDVSYDETNQLYLRAAECYLYMGEPALANQALGNIFDCAKTALDKAPAWVLQSRTFAQSGDAAQALKSLRDCLKALAMDLDEHPTLEKCDAEFERISVQIQTMDRNDILSPPGVSDASLSSVGAVLAETLSAAWWSDCPSFYHISLRMVDLHLTAGAFPQSGMGFLQLAMIALTRFNMVHFAVDLGGICLKLLDRFRDPFSMAQGYVLYATFIGHVQFPLGVTVSQLEGSAEYAMVAGDRISAILGYGLSASLKFFASENCVDVEAFCQYGCEEIPEWHNDTRGGTLLISIRQVCRAMRGRTRADDSLEVMTDEQHSSRAYKGWLEKNTQNGNRSLLFYETMEMIPLFLYGHYDRAAEVGRRCMANISLIWSARNSRLVMLFYGLSLAGLIHRQRQDPRPPPDDFQARAEETIRELHELSKKIKDWQVVSDVNYLVWSKLLDAQISELSGDAGLAIGRYEEALDHASEQSFVFEEALGNYLMAGVFIRYSTRRSARSALRDAVSLYRQFGATGIANMIEEEHSLLLHGPTRNPRTVDAAVQTDFAGDSAPVQYRTVEGEEGEEIQRPTQEGMAELKGERLGAWRGSMQPDAGVGLPALDMIDLHAILVSSQVISSVLRVDELLKTMCDVILQTCGGSATLAAIVVEDEGTSDWSVAASGDPERGASAHIPGIPLQGTPLVAENVVLYSTRFREAVFISDILNDERFGNVSESWLQRNPLSKAVIAIPICHGTKPLLGVLYLEGVPNSFTDRNVIVLQLLVDQIGISYSNALSMKAVEKVSAENVTIVSLQKRALSKALEAETKAKDAEAEAKRNVKLAEEAAKAKSIFLANVSHELRTPLNGVIGNSELLRYSNLNKDQLEMADSIRVSADLLLTVINDILDFSRMEADKMRLYVIAFNPEEMVREVVRAVSYSNREKTKKKNVKIIQDINLPTMLIYGDPIRLHQVLGNLIGNSLKFTETGSITIGARVDSDNKEHVQLTFWVKDTGIGIPPQQLANLFQPFSQADASTARKYGGSGLGLSICKSLIETMMKGKIQLESQENAGTTAWFTVTFDKAKPEASAGDAQIAASTLLDARPHSPSRAASSIAAVREPSPNPYLDLTHTPVDQLRICIAEDNAINQRIAIQYVQRLGCSKVDAYDNGAKAVEGLRQKAGEGCPYHVILMDVQMPVLDGYEATKLLRRDPIEAVRKILVIAMTASAIQGDREKCLAAGMNDYLAKPVRADVLRKKLDAYTGLHASSEDDGAMSPTHTPRQSQTENKLDENMTPTPSNEAFNRPPPEGLGASSGTSSDNPLSESDSINEAPPAAAKRQPRKLTKSRGNSEASLVTLAMAERPEKSQPQSQPQQQQQQQQEQQQEKTERPEKPKGVLVKKNPQRQHSKLMMDGFDASPAPLRGGAEGGAGGAGSSSSPLPLGMRRPENASRSESVASVISPGSKDRPGNAE